MLYNIVCTPNRCRYKPLETPFYPNFASTENSKNKDYESNDPNDLYAVGARHGNGKYPHQWGSGGR